MKPFVPENFVAPRSFQTDLFCFVVLSPEVAEDDFDAVMSSKERLRQVFRQDDEWPKDSMTLEFNIQDLQRHQSEFNNREAFAYAVLSADKARYIGCVYIDPTKAADFDAEVYLWVRDSELALDGELFTCTKNWLADQWPLRRIAFPGREIPWSDWTGAAHW